MNSDSKGFAIFCCMWLGMAAGLLAGWKGIACVSVAIVAAATIAQAGRLTPPPPASGRVEP